MDGVPLTPGHQVGDCHPQPAFLPIKKLRFAGFLISPQATLSPPEEKEGG